MENRDLYELFVAELEDMYSSEHQIVKSLPDLIRLASLPDLKDALTGHLKETKNQVSRIEKIFAILSINPKEITCEAMEGLTREAKELVANKAPSPCLDAAIISACQKIEHYEIASYGTLRSFANHLDLDSEIADLLQDTLDEEGGANKKLTKLADGSWLTSGINKKAAATASKHR